MDLGVYFFPRFGKSFAIISLCKLSDCLSFLLLQLLYVYIGPFDGILSSLKLFNCFHWFLLVFLTELSPQ